MTDILDAAEGVAVEPPAEAPEALQPQAPPAVPEPPQPHADESARNDAGRDNVISHDGDAKVENITHNYYRSKAALARYAADHGIVDKDLEGVIDPPDTREHLRALGEGGILVLTGPASSGLTTAATYRWAQFAKNMGDLGLRVLHPDNREDLHHSVDQSERHTVQLLDSSRDPGLGRDIAELLPRLRDALRDRGSHLVVAIDDRFHLRAAQSLPGAVFTLGRPDPRMVLSSYLDERIDVTSLFADERFSTRLARCWPPRVKKLAAILNRTGSRPGVDKVLGDLDDLLEDWAGKLGQLVDEFDPDARALLVSAASMAGAPGGSVALAADWFMDAVEFEGPHRDMLGMKRLAERFEPLKEVFHAGEHHSAFTESGYGEAVLPVLWEQFPSWREPMREWFDRLLHPSSHLDDEQTAGLLLRLLELASRTGDATLVLERATKLLSGSATNQRQELTRDLLVAAATDPAIGRQTRYQLWRWARNRDKLSLTLQRIVVGACSSSAYTTRYPDNAMHRLKYMVKSGDDGVHHSSTEAIIHIGSRMPMRSMLIHLTEWIGDDRKSRLRDTAPQIAARLFRHESVLARINDRPDALHDTEESATRFWKRLLVHATPADVRAVVTAWLALTAELRLPYRTWAADLLATAAYEDILAIGQLAQAVDFAARSELGRSDRVRPLVERLRTRLSRMEVPLS